MNASNPKPECLHAHISGLSYDKVLAIQKTAVSKLKNTPESPFYLFTVEHNPVFTLGRNADKSNLLFPEAHIKAQNAEIIQTDRGGDVTFHGPGQIVAYPILNLKILKLPLKKYIGLLEKTMIDTLVTCGISAISRPGLTGVWVGNEKIGSIGVHVSKWISYHGLALNINTGLQWFQMINPCGLNNIRMTSVEKLRGNHADFSGACSRLISAFSMNFKVTIRETSLDRISRPEYPKWLKTRLPKIGSSLYVSGLLKKLNLHSVCQSAKCPNIFECFGKKTAAFMILGNACTRQCSFCSVDHTLYQSGMNGKLDENEPQRVAQAIKKMKLAHSVITSVTRDDLPDKGAGQFCLTVREIRNLCPDTVIEILTPDFCGIRELVEKAISSNPHIFNHNLETVPRLYNKVRPQASYRRSLEVLDMAKKSKPEIITKSGLMAGVGETREEIIRVLKDLRAVKCDAVTIGQYLKPDRNCMDVARFVDPREFQEYKKIADELGFRYAACGPFVRSSYRAEEIKLARQTGTQS
ncbi:MAG: lipoyl synthase [Planctomycetes bacterium]|nr:lipoyl synthase [Planctomycetota bacterium]